jgi:hypothetical protein
MVSTSYLEKLPREKLLAYAELVKRGVDITPFLEPELSEQEIAEHLAKCEGPNGFEYFCTNFAYVIEPRPKIEFKEGSQLDFEKYLNSLSKADALPDIALSLMPQEANEMSGSEDRFLLYDYQLKLHHWLNWLTLNGESGAVEKCRDMGATWWFIWEAVYRWRFQPNYSALFGSKKAEAVDNGLLDSHFGKLDYAVNKLPDWLKPKGYKRAEHRRYMKLVNPETGNYLVGDSQNKNFGVGGRYTHCFPDETAKWDYDVSGNLSQTANTAVYNSTVEGQNHFWRITERLRARSKDLVFRLEWNWNPSHTKEWFKAMQSRMDEADFAREVLIDYQAAIKGKYYPGADQVELSDNLEWQHGWPSVVSLDYGVRDDCALIWWQRDPTPNALKPHRMMFCYSSNNKPIDWYIPILKAEMPEPEIFSHYDYQGNEVYKPNPHEYVQSDIDFIQQLMDAGVSGYVEYRGDPAGRNRSQDTATSIEAKLEIAGVYVTSNTKENSYAARRSALTDVLMNCVVSKSGAWEAFNAVRQARFAQRKETSESATISAGPVHDWTSHYRSSAEYYAVQEAPAQEDDEPVRSGVISILPGIRRFN